MSYEHPMRRVEFHAWIRQDGSRAIARGEPYGLCPMFFEDETAEGALAKAEAFRTETVEKHEAAYIARMEAGEARRAAEKKKKEAKS